MLPSRLFFNDFFDDFSKPERNLMKCDISQKDGMYLIEMDMPGMKKEDITMELDNGYLTISCETKLEDSEEKEYIHRERHAYTSCSRRFYVGDIEEEDIKASFKDGILSISVPQEEVKQTKKTITIE